MGTGETNKEVTVTKERVQERLDWIRSIEVRKTAIEAYLESIDKEVPENNNNIRKYVAEILNEQEFKRFQRQFRFGGQQSLNFFVLTGISDLYDRVKSGVDKEFPTTEDVEGVKGEPYFVDSREFNNRLYLILGYYESNKTTDPNTGEPNRRLDPDECIAVINQNTDLVHVRTADVALSRTICETIADAAGLDRRKEDIFYKPDFDESFIDALSGKIEKYINMSVRIKEGKGRTAGSVTFSSQKTESGDYLDLRKDEKVQEELEEDDGDISRGYVKLSEGDFSFDLNRSQSKIWFRNYEREERILEIEELINDVLEQSRGYPQSKLQGFKDVPE